MTPCSDSANTYRTEEKPRLRVTAATIVDGADRRFQGIRTTARGPATRAAINFSDVGRPIENARARGRVRAT
jgi:hypothetical protein